MLAKPGHRFGEDIPHISIEVFHLWFHPFKDTIVALFTFETPSTKRNPQLMSN
jgi:hypothetical protein